MEGLTDPSNNTDGNSEVIFAVSSPTDSKKRKKLSGDERLTRNRERNRIHARKTRERKRNQTAALQSRINELYEEGLRLRRIVDERYTASSLLGLSNKTQDSVSMMPSSQICRDYYHEMLHDNTWLRDNNGHLVSNAHNQSKRVRRSGKYTPQERERIRRERNRMHAKKTRDRKKQFLEMSEKIITEMEKESTALRTYLLSLNLITEEEVEQSKQRLLESKLEIEHLKANQLNEENDEEEDTETESEEDLEPIGEANVAENEEPSVSGASDENDKVSSWSGSNDGSSTNQGSSGVGTSRETNSSRSNCSDDGQLSSNMHSSSSMDKQSDNNSGNGSNGAREDGDSPNYNEQTNSTGWNEDDFRIGNMPIPSPQESYNHGKNQNSVSFKSPDNATNDQKMDES